jgi:hypothetical protein
MGYQLFYVYILFNIYIAITNPYSNASHETTCILIFALIHNESLLQGYTL